MKTVFAGSYPVMYQPVPDFLLEILQEIRNASDMIQLLQQLMKTEIGNISLLKRKE